MRSLVLAAILALPASQASPITADCATMVRAVGQHAADNSEALSVRARTANGSLVAIWANEKTGTWRLVFVNNATCEAWRGTEWTPAAGGSAL